MAITVNLDSVDRSDHIDWSSLEVEQNLTDEVDSMRFLYRQGSRAYTPSIGHDVEVYDDATKIFGGKIVSISESVMSGADGLVYEVACADHTYLFDAQLVLNSYENETIEDIIDDIATNYTDGSFTTNNVASTFVIDKIVFNGVTPSDCLKKLASILQYHWYIDPDKDIHFYPMLAETAPFDLEDDTGKFVYRSLTREIEGTQITNSVQVRGGLYDEASTYTDEITVSGNTSKSFNLPFKFANLAIEVNSVAQTVGVDFVDTFASFDVLYNYQNQSIRFNGALSDGDVIEFSGNRKVPVKAIAKDSASIAQFGERAKLIRDNSIEDLAVARKRAQAEILRYKDELTELKFRTYTPGLNVGMSIRLENTARGIDADYIIRRLTFTAADPTSFVYDVELVNTRTQTFQQLLAKLLEPDPQQASDAEVAEPIETDIQTVEISESISLVTAEEDDATIEIAEDIQDDPLGANTEPIWVLANYVPSPWPTDPKRQGLLSVSFKLT